MGVQNGSRPPPGLEIIDCPRKVPSRTLQTDYFLSGRMCPSMTTTNPLRTDHNPDNIFLVPCRGGSADGGGLLLLVVPLLQDHGQRQGQGGADDEARGRRVAREEAGGVGRVVGDEGDPRVEGISFWGGGDLVLVFPFLGEEEGEGVGRAERERERKCVCVCWLYGTTGNRWSKLGGKRISYATELVLPRMTLRSRLSPAQYSFTMVFLKGRGGGTC